MLMLGMEQEYTLQFGKHEGYSLQQVAKTDPAYIIWLSGSRFKYTLSEAYSSVKTNNPEAITASQEYLKNFCLHCFAKKDAPHIFLQHQWELAT